MIRRAALAATIMCALGLLVAAGAMRSSESLRARDLAAVDSFRHLDYRNSSGALGLAASAGDPLPYLLVGVGLAAAMVAFLRGRRRIAIVVPVLLFATTVSTAVLKLTLDQGTLEPGAFPSGHATAAITLALCVVLAVPPRFRPIAALVGVIFTLAVSCVIVSVGWHTPSDVLGGFLVGATLTGAAVTLLLRSYERDRAATGRTLRTTSAT